MNVNVTKTKRRCTELKLRIRYEEEQLRGSKKILVKELLTNYWRAIGKLCVLLHIYIYMIESILHGIISKC